MSPRVLHSIQDLMTIYPSPCPTWISRARPRRPQYPKVESPSSATVDVMSQLFECVPESVDQGSDFSTGALAAVTRSPLQQGCLELHDAFQISDPASQYRPGGIGALW